MKRSAVGRLAIACAVSGLTAIHFWPATRYEFLRYFDDGAHLEWTTQYKGLGLAQLKWMFGGPYLGQYMPLTWLSWAIDWKLWGLDPVAFHRTNILLHAIGAGLLFLVARRLIRLALPACQDWNVTFGAIFAALAWSLHPLRVESVAWVNERRDVLSGVFYLLAVFLYLRSVASRVTPEERSGIAPQSDRGPWTRGASGPRRHWLVLSVVCFTLAILSKALAVALPVTLLLLDWYPLRRRAWMEKAPYLLLAGIGAEMAFYSVFVVGDMQVMAPVQWITVEDRLLITPFSFWFYLAKTIWPSGLSPLHELTFTPHLFQWRYFIPVCATVAGTWGAIRWRRSFPAWSVVWVAYVVAVLPISGLFQNGYQLVATRYSYLATLPLLVLAGGLLALGLERARPYVRDLALAGAGAVVVALAVATTLYLPTFHDGIAFWTRAVQVEPSCVACSDFLVHQARFKHAHAEMARVIAAHPDLQEQRFEIGMLSFMYAHGDEGVAHFTEYIRQAGERDPGYIARIEVGRQKHLALARQVLNGSPQSNLTTTFEGAAYGLAPGPQR